MATAKKLRVVQPGQQTAGLGHATIMDRTLAAKYGAPYVHLVAFAIDVDRVFAATPEYPPLPFGWEVRLTEAVILQSLSPADNEEHFSLLEDTCLSVLDYDKGQAPLGSQLTFAAYSAVVRGALPRTLQPVFAAWRKPPRELAEEVAELAKDPKVIPTFAKHCLDIKLDPELVPPVREQLLLLAGTAP
jgi:hypothetical protein